MKHVSYCRIEVSNMANLCTMTVACDHTWELDVEVV